MSLWSRLKGALGLKPAEPPSAEELFAAEVKAALAAFPTVTSVTRGPEFSLAVGTAGGTQTMFLHNVFAETRDLSASERAERIRRFVSILNDPEGEAPPWSAVGDRLVPVLRVATGFQGVSDDPEHLPVRRRFLPFLVECVGLDSESSFRFVDSQQVARWGVDLATVFEAARENGARCFDGSDVARYGAAGGPAIWYVARDDSYESSRLILPGWLAGFAGKVAGRPIAIVPSRSMLMVGGDGDEAGLRQLLDSARREYAASPRNISPALYTVDDAGAVVPFVLPPDHPLATEVAVGQITLATVEYKKQQDYLQEKVSNDVFVATYTGIQAKDGSVFSYTTWTENVPSLLPRADRISFGWEEGGEKRSVMVPWKTAVDLVGDCLCLEPGHDPPRWRTERWPDPVTLEKLRAAAH